MSTTTPAAPAKLAQRISRISVSSTMQVAADAERLRRQGVDLVDFGAGEPDFPTPDNVKRAAEQAIEANFTRYTNTAGIQDLREAICERHTADYGTSYAPNECIVSAGGKQAIFNAMQALLDEGDEVIIPVPYWVTYKDVVNYAGARCVFVPTDESRNFALTADMVEPHLTERTKCVIINSPSNPSGAVLDAEEFARIHRLTADRGVWLLTDECYCRFLYGSEPFSVASLPGAKDNVIVAGSLSKTYAMTGWRIGFALAPAPLVSAMTKLQSHSTSNPTSVAQKAALEALRGPQDSVSVMLAEYRRRRDYVVSRLRAIPGIQVTEPQGAFYAYPNIGAALGRNGLDTPLQVVAALLERAHVAVVPGEAFGTDQHFRLSYATSMKELTRGLDRVEEFFQEQMR